MKEIAYEVTRNSSVDGDELDRYAVYRLLLLSFENDVRSGYIEFDELLTVEKVVADIIRPFIRLSSLDLKLSRFENVAAIPLPQYYDNTSAQMFIAIYGEDIFKELGGVFVLPKDANLTPKLLKK